MSEKDNEENQNITLTFNCLAAVRDGYWIWGFGDLRRPIIQRRYTTRVPPRLVDRFTVNFT